MDINEFEYVTCSNKKRTGTVACFAVALEFVMDALVNRHIVLGYGGRYISYTEKYNLYNEDIIIDVSLDTTNVDETTELIFLKYDKQVPDISQERIHWFGTKLIFSNWKDNTTASIYATIANDIKYILLIMLSDRDKKYCKVLSEIYKDDLK
jgi:hypothetical protein